MLVGLCKLLDGLALLLTLGIWYPNVELGYLWWRYERDVRKARKKVPRA